MINLEVVRREVPCKWVLSDMKRCRSCQWLSHVRGQGDNTTLCGVPCTEWPWLVTGQHPEDTNPIKRCLNCYQQIGRMKNEAAA